MKSIDLHTHTHYSDGALSPTKLVQKAKEIGLSAVGITDHDTLAGNTEAVKAGESFGIEVIPGCEFSTTLNEYYNPHIVGFFFDQNNTGIGALIRELQLSREQLVKNLITNFQALGYTIDYDSLRSQNKGSIGKPHIVDSIRTNPVNSEVLKRDFGDIPSGSQPIYDKYLKSGTQLYDASKTTNKVSAKQTIDTIHKAGGLAILAHPVWDLTTVKDTSIEFVADYAIEELVKVGLDGLEAINYRENDTITKTAIDHYSLLAQTYHLAISGGSDFHGFAGSGRSLGLKDENMLIDYNILSRLLSQRTVV